MYFQLSGQLIQKQDDCIKDARALFKKFIRTKFANGVVLFSTLIVAKVKFQ